MKDVEGDDIPNDGGEPLAAMLDAWEPQIPSAGFADRVLTRVGSQETRVAPVRALRRPWRAVGATAGALALAAAVLIGVSIPRAQGEAIAKERIEVSIGSRALAVLESGARVSWKGDDVVQSTGDVFYRVEPGARFTVHTPAGDVQVKGTCFTVKVRPGSDGKTEETDVVKRDVKAGVVGAALSALAFVAVYEGKVAVSHASESAELRAGESAQLGAGVKRSGNVADGEKAFAASEVQREDPTTAANQNLVRQIGEYRSRLEAVAAQKSELETKLKHSEEHLAASQDGSAKSWRPDFDVSADDWKEFAKDGTVKYQFPCIRKGGWSPSPEKLNLLGLAPSDAPTIQAAYARSNDAVAAAIVPICAQSLGSADLAQKIGPDVCIHLVLQLESEKSNEAAMAARRAVGEIRAGIRPMPGPNEPVNPVTKVFLAMTAASKNFEDDLAQSFGAEEAHRLAYADEMCNAQSTFGGSSKKR